MSKLITILFVAFSFYYVAAQQDDFKVIGYYTPRMPVEDVPFDFLTHINYSFAIPAKSGDTLAPIKDDSKLKMLVKKGKETKTEIFLSIGGWGIGDGGGNDTRFHVMAETAEGRARLINSTMKMVTQYGFDGVDLDWEYPDEDSPSADHYLELVKDLASELHALNKKLTAAVISYGKKGYGVKKETFDHFDWINLMAYDDDYGPDYVKAHSPFSLALKSMDYWIEERGLPREKAVLGLPFYAKKGMGQYGPSYKNLLKDGASPYDDYHMGSFYNGILTIELKTQLALREQLAGVMVWEISHDTNDEYSLFKKINQVVMEHNMK